MEILRQTKKYKQALKTALKLDFDLPKDRDILYSLLEEHGFKWWEEGGIWTDGKRLPYVHIRLAGTDVEKLKQLEQELEHLMIDKYKTPISSNKREYHVPRPDGQTEYRVVRTLKF